MGYRVETVGADRLRVVARGRDDDRPCGRTVSDTAVSHATVGWNGATPHFADLRRHLGASKLNRGA